MPLPPGTPEEIQPPAEPVPFSHFHGAGIDWQQAWPSVLLAGGFAGLVSFLPFIGIGFFLWVAAGGAWAISLYHHRAPAAMISRRLGWRLGAVTGLVSFAIFAAGYAVGIAFFGIGPQLRDALLKSFADAAAQSASPQSQQVLDFVHTPGGFATVVTIMTALFLVIFLLCGALGGALGASFLRGRNSR